MTKSKSPIPAGLSTVTPYLILSDTRKAVEFYKTAFGAEIRMVMPGPDGRVMHAEIKIGNSIIFLGDEYKEMDVLSPESRGGATSSLMLYVEDVDSAFNRAVEAGCSVKMPVSDQFWGDRFGAVTDPFGHRWSLSTHVEDVTPEEIKKRLEAATQEKAPVK